MAGAEEPWGARPEEWDIFVELGLSEDLLPTVCNTGAPISPNSKMKRAGKTPCLYNRDGFVAGIKEWTTKRATKAEVECWKAQGDYGICLQTRHIRAFDIDIEDAEEVQAILNMIEGLLERPLPRRYRENSNKCLLALRIESDKDYTKRVVKTEHGMVEFLATGQQFVAAGMHTSGARYEWDWHHYENIPGVSEKEFDKIFYWLETMFGVGATLEKGQRKARGGELAVNDATLTYLEEHGHVLDYGPEGQAHIECPFAGEHTTESDLSSTSYFPAGTRGYERGHFICLHAHCAERKDEEFLDAFGVRAAEFEVLAELPEGTQELPAWLRIEKTGQPKALLDNVVMALQRPDICGLKLCYDEFRDEIVFFSEDGKHWERENDVRMVKLRRRLEKYYRFLPIGRELMRDAAREVADMNRVDTLKEWVSSLKWDGKPRVDTFVAEYLGAKHCEYSTAVSRYLWSGLAGRAMQPGLKADMALVLKSPEGYKKTSAIEAMAPSPEEFCEIDFHDSDDDNARKMRGVVVAELSELRGLRTREIQSIMAFVSRRYDKWTPKYKEFATTLPRRLIFIGTTNEDHFLTFDRDHRRWLPFNVMRGADVEGIARDRKQLWAEGRVIFEREGLQFMEAERLARLEIAKFKMPDAWLDVIEDWLDRPDDLEGGTPRTRKFLRVIDVAREALNMDPRSLKRQDEMKICEVLKTLGFEHGRRYVTVEGNKKQIRAWFPPSPDDLC